LKRIQHTYNFRKRRPVKYLVTEGKSECQRKIYRIDLSFGLTYMALFVVKCKKR
jgi:hypothetical protein